MKASEYVHIAVHPKTHKKLLKVQKELAKDCVRKPSKGEVVDSMFNFYLGVQ